ncbi:MULTISPECIES: trypco2 family protein [Streptacidiphilus]|uniref:Trypco2 family protein n=1 Tax=Streptacidiphilus cavernicola TaxID=3342716 RepID=A0ABV6V1C1_9ACTN|nr:trypco2 family protein [Streptacidiphilus jeojiense]
MTEDWAELGDTVEAVREQLQRALTQGQGQPLKFRTGPVEMEFTVEVKKEAGVKAKVFVLPWTVEAQGAVGRMGTHRIKVTLQPVDDQGNDALISAQSAEEPE